MAIMSVYVTLAVFKAHLGSSTVVGEPSTYERLTDRTGMTTGDDVVGQSILDRAEAILHGALAARYRVPVDVSAGGALADLLRAYTLNVAAWLAYSESILECPEDTQNLYAETKIWLESVKKGESPLPGSPATIHSSGGVARRGGDDQKFNTSIYG